MIKPTLADNAVTFVDLIGQLAGLGQSIEKVRPIVHVIAQWAPIPYLTQIDHVLEVAAPYLDKVTAAMPQVRAAVDVQGRPIIDAIQQHGPDLLDAFRSVIAITANNDPTKPAPAVEVVPADVPEIDVAHFAGIVFTPGRTNAEQEREWNRDKQSMV